jgi:hypothetical protein
MICIYFYKNSASFFEVIKRNCFFFFSPKVICIKEKGGQVWWCMPVIPGVDQGPRLECVKARDPISKLNLKQQTD